MSIKVNVVIKGESNSYLFFCNFYSLVFALGEGLLHLAMPGAWVSSAAVRAAYCNIIKFSTILW